MKRIVSLCLLLSLTTTLMAQLSSKNELKKTTATEEKTHSIVLSNGNLTADNSELAALNADCANLVTVQRPRKILMTVSLGYKEVQLMLENTSCLP